MGIDISIQHLDEKTGRCGLRSSHFVQASQQRCKVNVIPICLTLLSTLDQGSSTFFSLAPSQEEKFNLI